MKPNVNPCKQILANILENTFGAVMLFRKKKQERRELQTWLLLWAYRSLTKWKINIFTRHFNNIMVRLRKSTYRNLIPDTQFNNILVRFRKSGCRNLIPKRARGLVALTFLENNYSTCVLKSQIREGTKYFLKEELSKSVWHT